MVTSRISIPLLNRFKETDFLDYFGDTYPLESTEDLTQLLTNYFGRGVSIDTLSEVISLYQSNFMDIEKPMTKEDFFTEMLKLFPDLSPRELSNLLTGIPTWHYRKAKSSPLSYQRKMAMNIYSSVKEENTLLRNREIFDKYRVSKIMETPQVSYTILTDTLQYLYSTYLEEGDLDFNTEDFSEMIYGEDRSSFITDKQTKKSKSLEDRSSYLSTYISNFFELENNIQNIKLSQTKIKSKTLLNDFKIKAKVLIRWNLLQEGYISIGSIREASILLELMFLRHDQSKPDFHNELDDIISYSYGYMKGLRGFGDEIIGRLEGFVSDLSSSEKKTYLENMIDTYRQNYMTDSQEKYRVGSIFHLHAEEISALRFAESFINFKNEKFSNYPNSLHRIDTWVKKDDNLEKILDLEILSSLALDIEKIEEFAIDYTAITISGDYRYIIDKLNKFYQKDPSRPLLIVIYVNYQNEVFDKIKREISLNKRGKNCRLISIDTYLDLFTFGRYKDIFKYISDLAGYASSDRAKFDELRNFDLLNNNLLKMLENE